tara:strand:+ start:154995 stop:155651 length:657 start_codon:yes stop_codon:yes gene_type:complete
MVVAIALAISAVAFLIVRTQGYVEGQEFSPTHFQARDFHFYEIPLLHVQMTPIRRSSSTPAVATYVRQNALIKPVPTGAPDQWHLVHLSRGYSDEVPADAEMLINQMNLKTDGKPYWRSWSTERPEHAKRFWPVIQRLAQRELYVLMPRLFEIAQQAGTPQQLALEIEADLRQNYVEMIRDMRAAGRDDLAEQLYAEAQADYPDDQKFNSLLDPSAEP